MSAAGGDEVLGCERKRGKRVAARFSVMAGFLLSAVSAGAQDATWLSNPGSNDLGVASNWSTGTVPTGTAFFGSSNTTAVVTSGFGQTFGGWTFNVGAPAYTVTLSPNGFNQINQFVGSGIAIDGGNVSIINSNSFNELNFTNGSSAGGAQITNFGGIQFENSSSAGSATITNNLLLGFLNSATAKNATIVNTPNSGVEFTGNSSAGNATIINRSFVESFGLCFCIPTTHGLGFSNTSTAGNATITTDSGLTKFFDQSTGGNARFISIQGIVDFSATTGPNGDGRVSAGSIEGSGTYFLGSRELTVGSNNLSTQVTGNVDDGGLCLDSFCAPTGGSLVKVGTGTLTLSGINTYTGPTTVNGGTLSVNGSTALSSLTTVNPGGALTGTGIVGNAIINGGIFMPGNGTPGSAMTVAGNLAFQSGSLYLIQLNPAASTFASVTGTASLNGNVGASFLPGNYVSKQYTIVSAAGGVNGSFASLATTNLPPGFTTSLSYDANDAYLNLSLALSQLPGLNGNQKNVANALSNFFNSTGGIPTVFATLSPAGLTQASGETATGSQQTTFDAMTQFLSLLLDPFVAGRGDNTASTTSATPFAKEGASSAYASSGRKGSGAERDAYGMMTKAAPRNNLFDPHWSIWAAGFGGSQTTDGNTALGSNGTTSRVFGTAVGADYFFSPRTIAGFSLAGGGTNFSVANGGSGRSDLFQAGAFVRHTVGVAYVSGALAYGFQDITTNRTVTVAGIDQLQARFNANALSGRAEGGYRFVTPWMGVTPYAAAQFTTFDLPAYAEQAIVGSNTFALAYNAKSVTDARSELGIRTDKSFAMQDAILTLRGRFAWAHDFNPDRSIAATFQALPSASFVVNGAAQASDSALTTASAEMKWMNGWSTAATFEGEFSDVTRSYAGKGVVRYTW
jgi:autotransporter-associated beta strand protein